MIELSLSMVFVATLLITISLVIAQLGAIYQKGLALRAVNSTGRELIDDFTRTISLAPAKGVSRLCRKYYPSNGTIQDRCVADNAELFAYHEDYRVINIGGEDKAVPIRGTFCTGRYSYIWNTGYSINNPGIDNQNRAEYAINGNIVDDFRLVRVVDSERSICKIGISTSDYKYSPKIGKVRYDLSGYESPMELLTGSEDNLVLYDLVAFPSTLHALTQHTFYSLTFILGTVQGGVDIMSSGDFCTAPPTDDLNTDFNYCAVNKFNFSVRATGDLTKTEIIERGYLLK